MTTRDRMRERSEPPRLNGKRLGYVYDRNDPTTNLKRIRVRIPQLGDYITDWAYPCGVHHSDHELPEVGGMVWVEFEAGNPLIPIWSYGPVPVGAGATDGQVFQSTNRSHGRRTVAHANGSQLVLDGTRGQEKVFLEDLTRRSRIGVGSGQEGWFAVSPNDGTLSAEGDVNVIAGGSLNVEAGGNVAETVVANKSVGIGGDRETTIGENDVTVVRGSWVVQAGEDYVLKVVNDLLAVIAGIEVVKNADQSGAIELTVKNVSGQVGRLRIDGEPSGATLVVEVTGDATIEAAQGIEIKASAGKVVLRGGPAIPPVPIGILNGNTLDRFTGTPFGSGAPGGSSLTVECTS